MDTNTQENEFERRLYHSFLFISIFIIFLSLGISLYYDITKRRQDTDVIISGTASYIASMPEVISMLETGYPSVSAKENIDSLCKNIPDINVVVICDKNGLRFYHTDRKKTGDTFVDGDETDILKGCPPYITTGYGTKGNQRRAFHSIKSEDGSITGFVMVSVFTAHISVQSRNIVLVHISILFLMLFVSISLTHTVMHFLKKSLMGYHPAELLNLYLQQDELLNALEEGLIASAPDGTIIFSNAAAQRLYSNRQLPLIGQSLKEIFPDTQMEQILHTGGMKCRQSCVIGGRTILISEIPIRDMSHGKVQGILTILFDRTEMIKLSDELSGTKTMLDTLRAFNHEFLNKLHVILGYLQTGETQKAITFIMNSNLVTSQSIRQTADCIRVSQICALIIGKMMHAAELGILLTLTHDSYCIEKDLLLPMESYITIIGNLLENAIEELNGSEREVKEIKLSLYCRSDCNIIICEDTGNGIHRTLLEKIFDKGVSSKGENRGLGLSIIKKITEDADGTVDIDTEEGEGTCFTLTFTRKEQTVCTGQLL